MTAPALPPEPWELEGRRLASLLDNVYAVVIAASDPRVAVQVALGVARAQSGRRRVAVADLIGEAPAIESLLTGDDPHGIADSFLYGVSLNKIARPMLGADNIFLMPSGTEPVDHEGVYANDRWRRLSAGFHQVGALLVVVARPTTTGFAELCGYIGHLMPVGEWAFPTPFGVPLIAAPPPPPAEPRAVSPKPHAEKARESASQDASSRRRNLIAFVLLLAAVAVGIGAFWPQLRDRLPEPLRARLGGTPVAAPDTTTMIVPPTKMDTVPPRDTLADTLASDTTSAAALASAAPSVQNEADSSSAARYAVYFAQANTRAAAMPDDRIAALEAVAVTPTVDGGDTWYKVTVGAHSARIDAEGLLSRLRAQKLIGAGSIVTVPFALRLERNVTSALLPVRLAALTSRGIVAYALQQPDGTANIYTGAFESPAQATTLADSLRATGVAPVLVYRTGRAF